MVWLAIPGHPIEFAAKTKSYGFKDFNLGTIWGEHPIAAAIVFY
jgi:hypothetical protein